MQGFYYIQHKFYVDLSCDVNIKEEKSLILLDMHHNDHLYDIVKIARRLLSLTLNVPDILPHIYMYI